MDEITTNDTLELSDPSAMKKRWLLTINNPVFADSGYSDEDATTTELEVSESHYDLSVLQENESKDFFEYKYIKTEKDGITKLIKRPFFKDLDCVEKYFKALKEFGNLKYAIYQYERGENGTPHIQGFIIYKNSKRFKNVKQDFPTAHIIAPNGSNIECRDYCTKKDTRISAPVEIGEFAEMRSRNDIVQFLELVRLGASNMTLQSLFPTLYAQYAPDKIERFRQDYLKDKHGQVFRDIKVTFIYGAARLGKTTHIYEKYPIQDICRVNNYVKGTFETYTNQKILVLDEFTGAVDITFMNNLLDKFPLDLPARFANRTACFDEVYVISNLSLNQLYRNEQANTPEVFDAFKQRFKNIIKFTALGVWHYELKDGKPVKTVQPTQMRVLEPIDDGDLPF